MYRYETTVNGRLRVLLMHISSPTPHCNHVRSKNNTVRNEWVGASRLALMHAVCLNNMMWCEVTGNLLTTLIASRH